MMHMLVGGVNGHGSAACEALSDLVANTQLAEDRFPARPIKRRFGAVVTQMCSCNANVQPYRIQAVTVYLWFVRLDQNKIMITWPPGTSWSALSSAAPIPSSAAPAHTLTLEATKLEALKLEVLRLDALVADRMQNKADALSATQAQPQWQAAAPAPAGSQKPSSPLPTTFPWQAATNPAAISAERAAEAAPRALATERVRIDSDRAVAARRHAEAEGLTLQRSDNDAGYRGVYIHRSRKSSPFKARVRRGGNQVSLGCFETADEAALAFARTPEAQEEVRDAKPKPLTAEEALTVARAEGLTLRTQRRRSDRAIKLRAAKAGQRTKITSPLSTLNSTQLVYRNRSHISVTELLHYSPSSLHHFTRYDDAQGDP